MKNSIAKNTVYYLIYTFLNIAFPFISGIYVARVLIPEQIGTIAYIRNIIEYFVIFSFLGIPTYALREIPKVKNDPQKLNRLFSELFFINLISTLVFFAIFYIVFFLFVDYVERSILYHIFSLSILFNILNVSWLFEGTENFRYISLRNAFFKVISFILLITFVKESSDYIAYAVITVLGTFGNNLINIVYSRNYCKIQLNGIHLLPHLKPLFILFFVNIAIEIYSLVDITMLGRLSAPERVAFYSYGSKISRILVQLLRSFTVVVAPRLSSLYNANDLAAYHRIILQTFNIIIMLALPIVTGIIFCADSFICYLYTNVFLSSATVLKILSVTLLISPVSYLLGSRIMLITGNESKMLICTMTGAFFNIIWNALLIPSYNEYGAAFSSSLSETVVLITFLFFSKKYLPSKLFSPTLSKSLIASAIMGIYLFVLPDIIWIPKLGNMMIQFFGAATIYFSALIILNETTVKNTIHRFFNAILLHVSQ